ncbi:MAG: DsbA family protein [Alphaproteobacteria bacterium]|nr:DsbA family protein [Alphaproteobacteria bacterium]
MIKKIILTLALIILCKNSFAINNNIMIGEKNAPVKIKVYYSMACYPCKKFHTEIAPQIERDFIVDNKASLEYVPYPLDYASIGVEAILSCIPDARDHYNAMSAMFEHQEDWTYADDRFNTISEVLSPYISRERIYECQKDKKSFVEFLKRIDEYKQKKVVRGTPTIYINGKPFKGSLIYKDIKSQINSALK